MSYIKSNLQRDFLSSIVVFLVALPLCMGIAIASGVPPVVGIITGIVGGVVVGTLSGAPLQVSGPAAGLTVLVLEIIQTHGIAMLGPIVLLAGLIQMVSGVAKLGQWFRAVNPAVIHGMLGGIGVLIFASQFHIMLDHAPYGGGFSNLAYIPKSIYEAFFTEGAGASAHMAAGVLGLSTVGFMAFWEISKKNPLKFIPAPLIAVVGGTFIAMLLDLPIKRVSIPDSVSSLIMVPTFDTLTALFSHEVLASVFGLALIASAETLLCASALTKMRADAEVNYDKELFAQGIGNVTCGILGALPMTGVIVRGTANIKAGAQTRASAIMHGVWLFIFVLLVPQLLEYIPMSSLAALLVFTGYKLVNPQTIKNLARYGKPAVTIYLITLVGIVSLDLLTGVLCGIAASMLRLITTFSKIKITNEINESIKKVDLHLSGAATVVTLPRLAQAIEELPRGYKVTVHFGELFYIDHACMDLLETERIKREGTSAEMSIDATQLHFKFKHSEKGDFHDHRGNGKDTHEHSALNSA